MSRLQSVIRRLGGIAATHELHAAGFRRETIRLASREGEIRRIRQGWYIHPDTPQSLADCLRVGGRATCVTAAELAGLWLPERPSAVHVAVRRNACQLRDHRDYRRRIDGDPGVVVHWSDIAPGGARVVVDLADALREIVLCQGAEVGFVVAESAFAANKLDRAEWERVCDSLPVALGYAVRRAGPGSGSITESVFMFRSPSFGVRVRRQVMIGPDRVDLVLGDRLIIEIDSKEFHERERDYARDARLGARGYRVLRFSYRQVMHDWPTVAAAVRAAIERGDSD